MKRSDFLKLTLLAPLARLFVWEPKPEVMQARYLQSGYLKQQAKLLGLLDKDETVYGVAMESGDAGETIRVRLLGGSLVVECVNPVDMT